MVEILAGAIGEGEGRGKRVIVTCDFGLAPVG